MFQLRRILLSGLVALLMIGMVTAGEVYEQETGDEVERSYIGGWDGNRACENTNAWKCVRIEFFIDFPIPW